MGKRRYQANGFIPYGEVPPRRYMPADTDTIVKGDVLHDDGNGYATNATTALDSATFLGVAAADCDNSAGSAGDLDVQYYPLDPACQFIVPVAANAVITATARGLNVDLENNDDIDISDAVTTGLGFRIDLIDITTEAIAANTYGYAIGHFQMVVTES